MQTQEQNFSRPTLILLCLGALAPIVRHFFIYTLGFITPGYSEQRDFLSELSAFGAPYATVMGLFGVGLVALMMIAAAIGLYRATKDQPSVTPVAFLVGLSGLGFILVALAPCDPGCVPVEPSLRMQIHMLGGIVGMGAEVMAALAFGIGGVIWRNKTALVLASISLGVVGTLSLAMLFMQPHWMIGNAGLTQRVVQGVGDLWLFIVCLSYAQAVFVRSIDR